MSSANFSSDEEVSPSRRKEKQKKMDQKNSILNYFKKTEKSGKVSKPAADPSSSKSDSPRRAEKREKPSTNSKYESAHSSSDEYDESWGRPWKDNAKQDDKQAREKTPELEPEKQKKIKIRKEKRRLWRNYSEKDTEDYRKGYPGKKDRESLTENKQFYFNNLPSRPRGDYIEEIHKKWFGNHALLEEHHGYIQWLFPIREQGMNFHAQELQLHEAQAITSDATTKARVQKSYELMLDFYGIKFKNKETGELERAQHYKRRFYHLNRSMHNYLRITRILKSLGELGYEHYKRHLVYFILYEALEEKTLVNCLDSCLDYWVNTIKDDTERLQLKEYAEQFVDFD